MKKFFAALGLGLAAMPGAVDAFVAPAACSVSRDAVRSTRLVDGHASASRAGTRRSKETTPTIIFGDHTTRQVSSASSPPSGRAGPGMRKTATATVLRARGAEEEEKPTSAAAMSGVGSTGSNILLLLSSLMVIKGLLLPENVRHMGFCPIEDPVRGRDTLPWRMMIESGRECGTVPEVMAKYITAPLAFPGTPEWGMMLNVKEDLAKDAWLQ
eukprot:g19904.t1